MVGMCRDLYAHCDTVKELFDVAEEKRPGITELCFSGPKESLDITINTQPALFLADIACATVLEEMGIKADGVAGFSLGEVAGACYSGLMNYSQAFDFVCRRAEAMHECAEKNKGKMIAVLKLSRDHVERICDSLEQVYPVNYNCPEQTVVACMAQSAEKLQESVLKAGGKVIILATSGAFHSPFMDEASKSLFQYLKNECHTQKLVFGKTRIPLYANSTAQPYSDPALELAKQVNRPVLWQKTIENMVNDGFNTFIEVGPGKTLSGLIRKINPLVGIYNVSDLESLANTVEVLGHA